MLMTKQLFEFLKSDNIKGAVLEVTTGIRRIEYSMASAEYRQDWSAGLAVQAIQLAILSVLFLAFLPLSCFTSACYPLSVTRVFSDKKLSQYFGMNNIREFNESPIYLSKFWAVTGSVYGGGVLLIVIIVRWKRESAIDLRAQLMEKSRRGTVGP